MASPDALAAANARIRGLIGAQLVRVSFGTGLFLGFGLQPFREVTIECPLRIDAPGHPAWSGEPLTVSVAERLLPALLSAVSDAAVGPDGSLAVVLDSGTEVRVPASGRFEAWQVTMDGGSLVVSMPGGELAVWAGE